MYAIHFFLAQHSPADHRMITDAHFEFLRLDWIGGNENSDAMWLHHDFLNNVTSISENNPSNLNDHKRKFTYWEYIFNRNIFSIPKKHVFFPRVHNNHWFQYFLLF